MCERYINQLPLECTQLGTWPATQACAPTGNRTRDFLVRRLALNPLSHTSQGTFISIYFMLNLLPGHKLLFLQFLLGYLFLLCNLLLWCRNKLPFLSEDHLDVAGRAPVRVDPATGSVSSALHLGSFVHLDVLNDQRIRI